jgi:transposase-like protein
MIGASRTKIRRPCLERRVPIRRGRLPGQCTICKHLERARAELLLTGGASLHSVAAKFGMGYYSLRRHWRNHISEERRAALILGPAQREALRARIAEESESVLDHHRAVRAGLYERYAATLEAGDNTAVALLAGRLTEVNNAISRLTGQLAGSPLIQNNTVNVFMHDPGFLRFMEELAEALGDYPEARAAVLRKFEELDRLEADPVETIPQLEYHGDAKDAH